jgi:hypothetical protein
MRQETRLKSAATLSELWDGSDVGKARGGEGISVLAGRRLSIHLMVQPRAASEFLHDEMLLDQGLLSRFLVLAPQSLIGYRMSRDVLPEETQQLAQYESRMSELLTIPIPRGPGDTRACNSRVVGLTREARRAASQFHDAIEMQMRPNEMYEEMTGFAAKSVEQALRIATILAWVEEPNRETLNEKWMRNGQKIALWFLDEAWRQRSVGGHSREAAAADKLRRWLDSQPEGGTTEKRMMQAGPSGTRKLEALKNALALLEHNGWITRDADHPRTWHMSAIEHD